MSENESTDEQTKEAEANLRRIVDSLVLMIKFCGITEQQFSNLVENAYRNVEVPVDSPTHDPSLSTGHRTFYGSILSTWVQDPQFLNDKGDAMDLPLRGAGSFERLYQKAKQAYPSTFKPPSLDETVRRLSEAGSITYQDGVCHLVEAHFRIYTSGSVAALNQISYGAELIETCAHNTIASREDRLFQRSVRGFNFPVSELPRVRALLREQGMELLHQLDSMLEAPASESAVHDPRTEVIVNLVLSVKGQDSEHG